MAPTTATTRLQTSKCALASTIIDSMSNTNAPALARSFLRVQLVVLWVGADLLFANRETLAASADVSVRPRAGTQVRRTSTRVLDKAENALGNNSAATYVHDVIDEQPRRALPSLPTPAH